MWIMCTNQISTNAVAYCRYILLASPNSRYKTIAGLHKKPTKFEEKPETEPTVNHRVGAVRFAGLWRGINRCSFESCEVCIAKDFTDLSRPEAIQSWWTRACSRIISNPEYPNTLSIHTNYLSVIEGWESTRMNMAGYIAPLVDRLDINQLCRWIDRRACEGNSAMVSTSGIEEVKEFLLKE